MFVCLLKSTNLNVPLLSFSTVARFIIIHFPICTVVLEKSVIVRKHNLWAQLHTFVTEWPEGWQCNTDGCSKSAWRRLLREFLLLGSFYNRGSLEKKQTAISINLHKHVSHISLASVSLNSVLTAQMELKPKNLKRSKHPIKTLPFFLSYKGNVLLEARNVAVSHVGRVWTDDKAKLVFKSNEHFLRH